MPLVTTTEFEARSYRHPAFSPSEISRDVLGDVARLAARDEVVALHAARFARTATGAWFALCAAAMVAGAFGPEGRPAVTALRAAWLGVVPVALVAWGAGLALAPRALMAAARRLLAREAVTLDTRASWSSAQGIERVLASAGAGGARAASWLLAGLALVAPLAIHYAFLEAQQCEFGLHDGEFGRWIRLSLVIIGHCHLVLAYQGWRAGRQLAAGATRGTSPWGALGWTTLASCFPGVFLEGLPVGLVAVTGAAFVPLAWYLVGGWVRSEREVVDWLAEAPPTGKAGEAGEA